MSDPEVRLYAAMRVAVPTSWRIATQRVDRPTPRDRGTVFVRLTRVVGARVLSYSSAVPLTLLESGSRSFEEATIALAVANVQQTIGARYSTPGPLIDRRRR